MAKKRISDSSLLWLTLTAAVVLTVWPLPELVRSIWPYWTAMVMVYWVLEGNRFRTLGQAFVLGIVLDVLTGSLLGQHALSLVIISFLLARFRNQLRFFPPWQQAVAVMALLLNDRLIHLAVIWVVDEPWPPALWWTTPLVGMMLWPWLFLGMDALRRRRRLS